MIISPTKNADKETYIDCADILETTIRIYQKMEEPEKKAEIEEHIKSQYSFLEWLKTKIDTHDYTDEDRQYFLATCPQIELLSPEKHGNV